MGFGIMISYRGTGPLGHYESVRTGSPVKLSINNDVKMTAEKPLSEASNEQRHFLIGNLP